MPHDGYPLICHNDTDSVVAGTDALFLASLHADMEDEPIPFRIPMVDGVPPEAMVRDIIMRVRLTLSDLTGEAEFFITPPQLSLVPGDQVPSVWFVRGLSPQGAAILSTIPVISNPSITLFIYRLTATPSLVITLGGLASNVGQQIENMVWTTFTHPHVRAVITDLLEANPIFAGIPSNMGVNFVLETLEVRVTVLDNGAIVVNVYLQSPGAEPEGWCYLRASVARMPFVDGFNALAVVRAYRCDVCTGDDHPMHACRFPTLSGWRGPVPPPEVTNAAPSQLGNALVFRPRNQTTGGARSRAPKGKGRTG